MDQLNGPRSCWTKLVQLDCNVAINITINNLEHLAANRTPYRQFICAPCRHILLKIMRIISGGS